MKVIVDYNEKKDTLYIRYKRYCTSVATRWTENLTEFNELHGDKEFIGIELTNASEHLEDLMNHKFSDYLYQMGL